MERPASLSLSSRPEGDLAPPSQTSFDRRIVRYEELHAILQVEGGIGQRVLRGKEAAPFSRPHDTNMVNAL